MIHIPDLANPDEKKVFDQWIEKNLTEDEQVHTQYFTEWNEIDDRLNGDIVIESFSQNFIQDLINANNPRVKSDISKRQYVQLQRARPNHEAILGDFVSIRRKLDMEGRTPKNRNIARAFRARVAHIEEDQMLPERVYTPLMDSAFAKGVSWIDVSFNARTKDLKGKFEISAISCRDILMDAKARGPFFDSARRRTHRQQLEITDANRMFRRYSAYRPVPPDSDYDKAYMRADSTQEDFATFYKIQFRQKVEKFVFVDPATGDKREISQEEFDQFSANPETADFVFEGPETDQYYNVLYNRTIGTFHIQENPFEMFTLIPLVNIWTESRLYPIGDVKVYANLLDLLDVLVTVFLENAKRANIPIVDVDPQMFQQYQQWIETAIKEGGSAPGIRNVHYPQSINAALTQLIPWVLGWIQDTTSKHSASMGELPSKQIAKETVQALIAKDRQAHGKKDVALTYCLTMLAKLVAVMISKLDTEPDFVSVTDEHPGQKGYIPINQRWTETEFISNIVDIYEIPQPRTPEEAIDFEGAIQAARKKFESENDIKMDEEPGYFIPSLPEGAQEFRHDEMMQFIAESGMSLEEFEALYQPQAVAIPIYVVNDLSQDPQLNIRYGIDTDMANDPEFKMNRALMLNSRGAMSRLDMLKELRMPNPEELIDNVDSENQAIQLAKAISANPQLAQAVQTLLQASQAQPAAQAA